MGTFGYLSSLRRTSSGEFNVKDAVTLEQRADTTNTLTVEPGAFMLHELRKKSLVSHHIQVGRFEGPHPFCPVNGPLQMPR